MCLDDGEVGRSSAHSMKSCMLMSMGKGNPVVRRRFVACVTMRKPALGVRVKRPTVCVIDGKVYQALQGSERKQGHAEDRQQGGQAQPLLARSACKQGHRGIVGQRESMDN